MQKCRQCLNISAILDVTLKIIGNMQGANEIKWMLKKTITEFNMGYV